MVYDIRAHHALCLAFYEGKGYSREFIYNMNKIKKSLGKNASVRLLCETDSLCFCCPHNIKGCCDSGKKVLSFDEKVLSLCGFKCGQELSYNELSAAVKEKIIAAGRRREVCSSCMWDSLCTDIYNRKYR